ncbi:MAG: hypothetical protein IAF58_06080 [Leptolyngbya sp.]|nr:hypothetical protein [Candidatus Melainabacteria bacterium]
MNRDAAIVSNMMAITNSVTPYGETDLLTNSEENARQTPDYLTAGDKVTTLSDPVLKRFDWETAARSEMIDEIERLDLELKYLRERGKYIAQELDLFRQRRTIFWSDRFRNSFNAWSLVSKGFLRLKDDTSVFFGSLKNYRLQPSISLLRVPYISYEIELKKANLSGIALAPIVEVPLLEGEICLQILGKSQELLAEASASVTGISDDGPVVFRFSPLAESASEILTVKIFVQSIDSPVRLLEMRKYAYWGFGGLSTKCFAGFFFDNEEI